MDNDELTTGSGLGDELDPKEEDIDGEKLDGLDVDAELLDGSIEE